jgi:hypothetical protein
MNRVEELTGAPPGQGLVCDGCPRKHGIRDSAVPRFAEIAWGRFLFVKKRCKRGG